MEITEKDRMIIIERKEEISKLSQEILEINKDNEKFESQLMDMRKKVIQIISLIHIIGDYGESSRDLIKITNLGTKIIMDEPRHGLFKMNVDYFCIYANSITFSITSKGFLKTSYGKFIIPGLAEIGAAIESDVKK